MGAVEVGLDLAGVAKEVAEEVVVGVSGIGLEGEGKAGVGAFGEGILGVEALTLEVVDEFLEEDLLEADFDLLGAEDAPGVGGELGDEEGLVGVLGGEIVEEAVFEDGEVGGGFEGEDGEFGGEAVGDGVEAGFGFTGGGARAGGPLRILLTGGFLSGGEGSWHESRVAWRFGVRSRLGGGGLFVLFGVGLNFVDDFVVTDADGGEVRGRRIPGEFWRDWRWGEAIAGSV